MSDELKYEVSIEGQKVPLPAQLADDDQKIIAALVPYFPGIVNGKIMRGEAIDGLVTITVIKQAGTKGASKAPSDQIISNQGGLRANHVVAVSPVMVLIPPSEGECGVVLRKLQKAKSEKNPVVALMERLEYESIQLQELPPHELIKMDGAIGKALKDGEKEADWMKDTARFLAEATPMSSPVVPEGF